MKHAFAFLPLLVLIGGVGCFSTTLIGCVDSSAMRNWVREAQSSAPNLEILPDTARPVPEKPFHLILRGHWPSEMRIEEPPYPSYITEMIVRNYNRSLVTEGTRASLTVSLQVEAPVAGIYHIPAIPLILYDQTGKPSILRTLPLFLDISLAGLDSATELRPLKPLRPMFSAVPLWVGGCLGLTLIGALLIFWMRRRRNQRIIPPEEILARALADLATAGDSLLDKDRAFLLSFHMRAFMEQKTAVMALEMTAYELVFAMRHSSLANAPVWMELADLTQQMENIKFNPQGLSTHSVTWWLNEVHRSLHKMAPEETA